MILNENIDKTLEDEFKFSSRQLATLKLYSLIRHLINDKKYQNQSPERKIKHLEKILGNENLSSLKKTSLKGDVTDMVR
jgi:hypothetical protein